jgi:hypothetical protein
MIQLRCAVAAAWADWPVRMIRFSLVEFENVCIDIGSTGAMDILFVQAPGIAFDFVLLWFSDKNEPEGEIQNGKFKANENPREHKAS